MNNQLTCKAGVSMTRWSGVSNIMEIHDMVVTKIITQSNQGTSPISLLKYKTNYYVIYILHLIFHKWKLWSWFRFKFPLYYPQSKQFWIEIYYKKNQHEEGWFNNTIYKTQHASESFLQWARWPSEHAIGSTAVHGYPMAPLCLYYLLPREHQSDPRKPQVQDVSNFINIDLTVSILVLMLHDIFFLDLGGKFQRILWTWMEKWWYLGLLLRTGSLLGTKQT